MALSNAHEGYEYQDLLTCYFILQEILNENNSEFVIDRKEFEDDKIDDLTIFQENKKFKKQIKYSNADVNHRLTKNDLASESAYQLSLDTLYQAWNNNPQKDGTEFRICLSWLPPVDTLLDILTKVTGRSSFNSFETTVYQIDCEKLWPEKFEPLTSWRRFKAASKNIDRVSFLEFCNALVIEVSMPKLSLNLWQPGELETLVLNQSRALGIGVYPNEHWKVETFILSLLAIVKRSRSKLSSINTAAIFHELNIITDYGSIEQSFPIVEHENISRRVTLEAFINNTTTKNKLLLIGEPGSGKSWFIENLTKLLRKKGTKVVRHFCYTKLDDTFQKERIKLNVFYGNLISELIEAYPTLKKLKAQKYASNLNELNNLLHNIDEPTYVFIDGLDHIDRIATYRDYVDINKQDIAIIENIARLDSTPHVKLIVTSQNIEKLKLIENFEVVSLPKWTESDIKKVLKIRDVKKTGIEKGLNLSKFLLEKSAGNPLYLKYLIDEIVKCQDLTLTKLQKLPDYSFNLSEYYTYLLSQLNTREEVPQVLCGVSFSLSKLELEEITNAGDHVTESLKILTPVLTVNIAQNGYRIYHESFRRFILEYLKSRSISINKKIFNPIQEWFDTKDFFTYRKSFRYYLQFLYEGGNYREILNLLTHTFVTDSVINGYSWELIERNYRYFVKSACNERDFGHIILLNEIDKVIGTCPAYFEGIFMLYLETLGKIFGFSTVSEYLLFDGLPTMPLADGLKACYVCDENNIAAPWNTYMEYFIPGSPLKQEEFKYFVRGLLVLNDEKRINRLAKKLVKDLEDEYCEIFRGELMTFNNQEYVSKLRSNYPPIGKIQYFQQPLNVLHSRKEILDLADQILNIDSVSRQADTIRAFIQACRSNVQDDELFLILIDMFKGKNWFYNWVIYNLKIIRANSNSAYHEIKSAFDYLGYNTEPFLGKPRTCDLYSIHGFIYQSIHHGLKLIKSQDQWKATIDTLVKVSNDTTTSIQKSLTGPLPTDRLFRILSEYACPENISYINEIFETLTVQKKEYHLHMDIAEYNFRLASIAAESKDKKKALDYFKKGVQFSLAYTMRKDLTLVDVIEGIKEYAKISNDNIKEDLRISRMLVDSAVDHTDGKETYYFPELWFKSFLQIDLSQSLIYLLHQLAGSRYDWRAEASLADLLVKIDGQINPEIEAYLALMFPVKDSSEFIQYCLTLYRKLLPINHTLAEKLSARLIPAMQPKKDRYRAAELVMEFNETLGQISGKVSFEKERPYFKDNDRKWYHAYSNRKDISLMTEAELLLYFDSEKIESNDLISLTYVLDKYSELNEFTKDLISTIVNRNNNRYNDKVNLDEVFSTGNDIECYYWICRFVNDRGGWFQKFVNQEAFHEAHKLNADLAFTTLFELLPTYLEVGFNSEFSSNLIKLLVSLGYDKEVVTTMWQNLLKMSSYRLPVQEALDWEAETENSLEMDNEEILLSIMICRYRGATTERYRWTTAALEFVIDKYPEKLIKPFKWFLSKKSSFPKSTEILILQFIYEQKLKNNDYHKHFEEELKSDFPSRYFITDKIIADLYGIRVSPITTGTNITYPEISEGDFEFIYHLNRKFKIFEMHGIDIKQAFSKFINSFQEKYEDYFELYANRVYKKTVSHIYAAEYMLKIMNEDHYDEFRNWSDFESAESLNYGIFLAKDAIATYGNSFGARPDDLKKPYEMTDGFSELPPDESKDWVRIAHQENAFEKGSVFKLTPYKSYGGVVFSSSFKNSIPYSDYALFPFQFWWNKEMDLEIDGKVIFGILQDDPIEYFKLLWLNPMLVRLLALTTKRTHLGLVAVNESNEVVLRMRTWCCEYLGDRLQTRLSDEIPMQTGTDLIMRKDYFQKLKEYFDEKPIYHSIGIQRYFS